MLKLVFVVTASIAAMTVAAATAAAQTAADFVIFKNNTPEDWVLQSQSASGSLVNPFPANLNNPPGGLKSEFYTAPARTSTFYSSIWALSDGTKCSFSSSAFMNSFGNMQFTVSGSASGPRAAMVTCGTVPVGSNLDGSYDFNHSTSFNSYSTYMGFSGNDTGTAIAVDSASNTYIAGTTDVCGPTPEVYVAKLNSHGVKQYEVCLFPGTTASVAVDSGGNAYVASGDQVAKINSTASAFVYNVALSGWTFNGVAVDASGNAYVTGSVNNGLDNDVLVVKLNPTATTLVYAVSFGGTSDDVGNAIAIDGAGNAYLTGNTKSADFPTLSAVQGSLRGTDDAFVVKLNTSGTALGYATYLGGDGSDTGKGIVLDSAGNAYVVGTTLPLAGVENFPTTPSAAQVTPGGAGDAFVAKITTTATLGYASYLGGSGAEQGTGIGVDSTGAAWVTGSTQSTNFPVHAGPQTALASSPDAFVAKLDPTGATIKYSGYLGGNSSDAATGLAVDQFRRAYVVGTTSSTNFSTTVTAYAGGQDAFITQF